MKIKIESLKNNKKTSEIEINDKVFNGDISKNIIRQYVYVYLSNQRQSNAHTKTRTNVRGGGSKPWNQKGTGRARSGSIRSPLFRGGGVIFGSLNNKNYKKSFPKKMRQKALFSSLSLKYNNGNIKFVDSKDFMKLKKINNFKSFFDFNDKKTLIIQDNNSNLHKYLSNINNISISSFNEVNTYDIINHLNILIFDTALVDLKAKYNL